MFDELGDYFAARAGRVKDFAERASAGPLLVRLGVTVFAALSLVLGFPAAVMQNLGGILVAGIVALLPGLFPRSRLVGLAIFACAFGWLAATTVYGEPVWLPRLVALSAALYLMHSLAALAAVLPYDAVVSPGVLSGWLLRALAVVAASALVSVALMLAARLTVGPVFLAASLAGVLAAGVLAWMIARRT
ncbi:hypothetical protein [Dactylosporangium sp. CA-092794]|uniref:hypothetical protein n=1 Tax=Dactylosporangium sp. CA-092794 TaxID=3239929 RepID=UPI003D931197